MCLNGLIRFIHDFFFFFKGLLFHSRANYLKTVTDFYWVVTSKHLHPVHLVHSPPHTHLQYDSLLYFRKYGRTVIYCFSWECTHTHTHKYTPRCGRMLACLLSCDVSLTQIHSHTQTNCSDDACSGQKYLGWKKLVINSNDFVVFEFYLVVYTTHTAVWHRIWVRVRSCTHRWQCEICDIVPEGHRSSWAMTPFVKRLFSVCNL